MSIKAEQESLNFLKGFKFVIPYFQRRYVWNEDNWKQLYDNLISERGPGFIGSIILKKQESYETGNIPPECNVIDGQQRLTTVSIFLMALYTSLNNKEDRQCYEGRIKEILFYTAKDLEGFREIPRLEPGYLDKSSYDEIINAKMFNDEEYYLKFIKDESNNEDEENCDDKIKYCYQYFYNKFIEEDYEKKINLLENLLTRYVDFYVQISISETEDEQKVFDTLNTTGKKLTVSDTIKNYLFSKATQFIKKDIEEQYKNQNIERIEIKKIIDKKIIDFYNETWKEVFEIDDETDKLWNQEITLGKSVKRSYVDLFLYSYAVIGGFYKQENTLEDLALVYKEKINSIKDKDDIEKMIRDLKNYALKYKEYFIEDMDTKQYKYTRTSRDIIDRILLTETITFYPYILYLLFEYSGQELIDELHKIEKIIFSTYIYKTKDNKNFNRMCIQFIENKRNNVNAEKETSIEYKIKELEESNIPLGLYKIDNNLAKKLLFIVELYRMSKNENDKNNQQLKYDRNYQLEHIMPRKWEKNWNILPNINDNGEELSSIEEKKIYRNEKIKYIGNMTILNSKLNDRISNSNMFIKIYGDKIRGKNQPGMKENSSLKITVEDVIMPYIEELNTIADGKELTQLNSKKEREKDEEERFRQLKEQIKNIDNIWNEKMITNRTEKIYQELKEAVLY